MMAVVHAETSTGVEHPLAELGALAARPRHPADGGLRHVARRRAARGGRVGRGLRLLVHAEVPGRPARHVSGGGVGAGSWSGCARAALRCRSRSTCCCSSATGWSGRRPTTTRRRSLRSTRCTRRFSASCARGSTSAGRGMPRRGAHLQASLGGARPRAARGPVPPAGASHGRARPGAWTARPCRAACSASTASR